MYEKGIGKINVSEYNWLNFFLTKKDKLDMLIKGAQSATEFLMGFNWQEYKSARADLQEQINDGKLVATTVTPQQNVNA